MLLSCRENVTMLTAAMRTAESEFPSRRQLCVLFEQLVALVEYRDVLPSEMIWHDRLH